MLTLLPRLRRLAWALTGSADEADELVQATVERAIRHIAKWQPGTRLDNWMFEIARNLHLNRVRALRVRGAGLTAPDPDDLRGADGWRVVESRLTLKAVRQKLLELPAEQRMVLLLVCIEDLPYKQVAEITGVPLGTVSSRLARARMSLRAFLNGVATTVPEKVPSPQAASGVGDTAAPAASAPPPSSGDVDL
jgi:RNA polymerase sigma-70 factor (ECF subfamily)